MYKTMLKSKLNEVIVTSSSEGYEGSITIDPILMLAASIENYEQVYVNGMNGSRIMTYAIPAKEKGTGIIEINGAASKYFEKGDRIHILSFIDISVKNIDSFKPIIVKTVNNKII